jgi:hypothetical protein
MRHVESDNEKAVEWIRGEAEGSGMKHAEMKFHYMQDEYQKGGISVKWVSGKSIVCDAMTKVVPRRVHLAFRHDIQGLGLLSDYVPDSMDEEED